MVVTYEHNGRIYEQRMYLVPCSRDAYRAVYDWVEVEPTFCEKAWRFCCVTTTYLFCKLLKFICYTAVFSVSPLIALICLIFYLPDILYRTSCALSTVVSYEVVSKFKKHIWDDYDWNPHQCFIVRKVFSAISTTLVICYLPFDRLWALQKRILCFIWKVLKLPFCAITNYFHYSFKKCLQLCYGLFHWGTYISILGQEYANFVIAIIDIVRTYSHQLISKTFNFLWDCSTVIFWVFLRDLIPKRSENTKIRKLAKKRSERRQVNDVAQDATADPERRRINNFEALLKDYECPVCLEIMEPPKKIFGCSNDHHICSECLKSSSIKCCPICRESYKNKKPDRRFTAEKSLSNIQNVLKGHN